METLRQERGGRARKNEHGFTLPEVLVTILIMGILFAIASSTWQATVESRRVDSAANQLASDMRRAHSSATNQLRNWEVVLTNGVSTYSVGPTGSPSTRDLDEDPDHLVVSGTAVTVAFCPDGSAEVPTNPPVCPGGSTDTPSSSTTIRVMSEDGSPSHDIEVVTTTSRVEVDP